ncbi:MAG: sensor histidine kinase [Haloferacaceae archaeon]
MWEKCSIHTQSTSASGSSGLAERPLSGLAAVAVGLALAALGWTNLLLFQPGYVTGPLDLAYELFINGGLALVSSAVVYRSLRSRLSDDDVRHLARWYVGAVLFIWGLVVWANAGPLTSGTPLLAYRRVLLVYGGLAGFGGAVAGRNRAQARQNRRLLDEQERRRERLARQRDAVQFTARLLRHDLGNGLTVIAAHADALRDHEDDQVREHAAAVADRTDRLADLSERVREFTAAVRDDSELTAVDVAEVVDVQARSLERTYPDATVSVDAPDAAYVQADDFLASAVANVAENAVEHNDQARPTVEIDVEPRAEDVLVEVRDDGPGMPEDRGEALTAPSGGTPDPDHGVGLTLVRTIVDRYDGDLRIREDDPRGTVVTFSLPRASA